MIIADQAVQEEGVRVFGSFEAVDESPREGCISNTTKFLWLSFDSPEVQIIGIQQLLNLFSQIILSLDVFLNLEEYLDIELEEIFLALREALMQNRFSFLIIPGRLIGVYFGVPDLVPKFCIE